MGMRYEPPSPRPALRTMVAANAAVAVLKVVDLASTRRSAGVGIGAGTNAQLIGIQGREHGLGAVSG